MARFVKEVNKKHYYFSIVDYGKIIDAFFADEDEAVGKPVEWYEQNKKRVWAAHFKLYNETENILERIEDLDDCSLSPLYRHLGQDDEDFIFESREEAVKEYTSHIEQAIADRLYNL